MKNKFILGALMLLALGACSNNKEYVYNQVVSAEYYSVSRSFEEDYQKFSEGRMETRFEYNNDEYWDFHPSRASSVGLKKHVKAVKERINALQPSEKAMAFHNKINEYFDLVGNDFADTMIEYVELNCECPKQKDSLSAVINELYSRISDIEDQCLEAQKKYIDAVGGRGMNPDKQ